MKRRLRQRTTILALNAVFRSGRCQDWFSLGKRGAACLSPIFLSLTGFRVAILVYLPTRYIFFPSAILARAAV
jgi:hypothetical protein